MSISDSASTMSDEERETHLGFMREALNMANLALQSDETPVGCVFVYQNRIIGRGMNATNATYNGTRHAEFIAIDDILYGRDDEGKEKGYGPEVLKECDLYVTVEPCIMCASLLRQFGVRKVFFGASNEKFGGTGGVFNVQRGNGADFDVSETEGVDVLKTGNLVEGGDRNGDREREDRRRKRHEDDYEVSGGWLREEAIVVLRRFYVQENGRAPEPRGKKERVLKLEVEPVVKGVLGQV